MTPFTVLEGVAAPLPLPNVDTDLIIRIERLSQLPRAELGPWAFEPLRYLESGAENADFVYNRTPWRAAPILVADVNFGCGSSREHAVWALQGLGVRCVVAPSFGDIFRDNCVQNGVLPIQLPPERAQALLAALMREFERGVAVSLQVDLRARTLVWPQRLDWHFELDERRRNALLQGLDEVGLTVKMLPRIRAWQDSDHARRPWVWRV